jgi:hypothetical protein
VPQGKAVTAVSEHHHRLGMVTPTLPADYALELNETNSAWLADTGPRRHCLEMRQVACRQCSRKRPLRLLPVLDVQKPEDGPQTKAGQSIEIMLTENFGRDIHNPATLVG